MSTRQHRIKAAPLAALLIGVALIPLALAAAVIDNRDTRDRERRALANEADQQAESLRDYFGRSRSLSQVMASNPAFEQFYELPGTRLEKVRSNSRVVREAAKALSYLEELFPDSIGEACFIHHAGPENARAVKGRIESIDRLSPDETGASFFGPAFALRPGQVYQAKPYVSPDTHEWVVANAIPIRTPGARSNEAIIHFEITVESFRRNAAQSSERFDIAIVDAGTGRVIVDSRYPQVAGRNSRLGSPSDRRFVSLPGDAAGKLQAGDRDAAYQRVGRHAHNANDWIVVASARNPTASWLGSLGFTELVILVGALLMLAFGVTSLRSSQRELREAALEDPLTGLPNRRTLMADLEWHMREGERQRSLLLLLFDLDGFKAYNDAFGHPAGDSLLIRLGRKLASALEGRGKAYRMGGDEFCVLAPASAEQAAELEQLACAALAEEGEGFSITASGGSVLMPTETSEPSEAMRKADQRMYARKNARRTSAARQSIDVLLKVLAERSPDLGTHLDVVTELCERTGRRLALSEDQMTPLVHAASLHDVGKAAIPDSILNKRGPLDDSELAFIRRHTLIGERIVGAAPALTEAAKLVRWSHERFDGKGYPDGLAGEDIPLGARVIAVADSYDAMISGRPYRPAVPSGAALEELRRCAGRQFDPVVVEAFAVVVGERQPRARPELVS